MGRGDEVHLTFLRFTAQFEVVHQLEYPAFHQGVRILVSNRGFLVHTRKTDRIGAFLQGIGSDTHQLRFLVAQPKGCIEACLPRPARIDTTARV